MKSKNDKGISANVEEIFATAVALNQSGGLKNTIYVIEDEIFIMNYDHTVLLRFRLRKFDTPFEHPISFKADDYASRNFEEVDGKIIFHSDNGLYTQKKICGTSDMTPQQIQELYLKYEMRGDNLPQIQINKSILEFVDSDLSHIEFHGTEGEPIKLVQRNIYSGGIIEIEEKVDDVMFPRVLSSGFGPIALKTGDFRALFEFCDTLNFTFPISEEENFISVVHPERSKRSMSGVLACCLYDEIIQLKEAKTNKLKMARRT